MNRDKIIQIAKDAIEIEAACVQDLNSRIGDDFIEACSLIEQCSGRVIVIGMGKSGHIGSKIAATLASTGTPAFFIHPAEASHGDLGMITKDDIVIAISNSGETEELLSIIPTLKLLGIHIISMTGKPESTLAQEANVNLNIGVEREACPLQLAPTSSTTATLVMGDALAIAMLEAKGFTSEDFARSHPGGSLGKRLLKRTKDLMVEAPTVKSGTLLEPALRIMTDARLGHVIVADESGKLMGIFSDGDVRRTLMKNIDISKMHIDDVMTRNPMSITESVLATEALRMMESKKITALPVLDDKQNIVGILHIHDILRVGLNIS